MADTWEVLSQKERTGELADGSFGPVVRITFRTALGVVGSVDIPAAAYADVDYVRDQIDAAAKARDAVASL